MKKYYLLFAFFVFALPAFARGTTDNAQMDVFIRDGCPHCIALEEFVSGWDGGPTVRYHNISERESRELFAKVQERSPGLQQAVPVVIINGTIIQGYDADDTTGRRITGIFNSCVGSEGGCITFGDFLSGTGSSAVVGGGDTCGDDPSRPCTASADGERFIFNFWFVGRTDLRELSIPVLSLLLGILDGFNPCAMWVLITLLTLLIGTRSWKKIWVIGGTFLFVSGAMYYLFIAAWLNVFLLIGLNAWVQKIIGLVAIGGGSFYLYEAFGGSAEECKVTDLSRRRKMSNRMKSIIAIASWPAMIIGVSILAFSVNLIELVCTAGLPAIFTEILAFNHLSALARYWYMFLYIAAYMADDIVVFAIAVTTLHATGLTGRYSRFSLIFGGVLMLVLGVLLIFRPEMLVF